MIYVVKMYRCAVHGAYLIDGTEEKIGTQCPLCGVKGEFVKRLELDDKDLPSRGGK